MEERRTVHRGRTYLGGEVAFNNRRSILDCLVRNLSQFGAKIVFSHAALVPTEFDMVIPQKGDSRRARIVWREDKQAGIAFLQSEAAAVLSIEAVRRIKALEKKRDQLARRVSELSEPTC